MKKVALLAFSLLTFGYTNAQVSNTADNNFEKLAWLVGKWTLITVKPGISGNENWSKISDLELNGYGITLQGYDTAAIENLKIIKKDNDIFYVADIKENKEPVYFKITGITDKEFIAENPRHDFPKMITYKRDGNKLTATISGNGKSIDYLFEKSN